MTIINNNSYIPLLNTDPNVMMYYSKKEDDFVALVEGEKIPSDYVEVPFEGAIEDYAMRHFWSLLGHSAFNRPNASGFHAYIRKHGLEEDYYKFERSIIMPCMKVWAKANGIVLNWDKFTVI